MGDYETTMGPEKETDSIFVEPSVGFEDGFGRVLKNSEQPRLKTYMNIFNLQASDIPRQRTDKVLAESDGTMVVDL